MVIGTSLGLPDGATVALAVALAFVFGYALTCGASCAAGLPFRAGACGWPWPPTPSRSWSWRSSTTRSCWPSRAPWRPGIASFLFWASLAGALAVAFVVTLPVNRP